METMVKYYSAELLPVAAQLTARLVSGVWAIYVKVSSSCSEQCELYQRLVKETVASLPDEEEDTTYDASFNDLGEDKTYAAMGMSKTILTVRHLL